MRFLKIPRSLSSSASPSRTEVSKTRGGITLLRRAPHSNVAYTVPTCRDMRSTTHTALHRTSALAVQEVEVRLFLFIVPSAGRGRGWGVTNRARYGRPLLFPAARALLSPPGGAVS